VDALRRRLERQGIASTPLETSHAFHSPLVAPAVEPLLEVARQLPHAPPRIPLVSNTTGEVLAAIEPQHWGRHVLAPVRFADGARSIARLGGTTRGEIYA